MQTADILKSLIEFDTVSRNPNMALIDFVAGLLRDNDIEFRIVHDATEKKANLFAAIGPKEKPGIMLSGHTDVVPVDGQDWTKPPFELTEADGRYYGRGTADMKGFVACAISAMIEASKLDLKTPLQLALSHDEEIGCVGVHSMIDMLAKAPIRPAMCIVGEPTNLAVATGHKGRTALAATCIGREGHSALAPFALNAVHLGCDFVNMLREMQDELAANGHCDSDYDVPYSTIHVGKFNGGVALNIVPNHCEILFEVRNVAEDDPNAIVDEIRARAAAMVNSTKPQANEADIQIEITNACPGLNTPTDESVVKFVKSLTMANDTMKVAFGTEGGLFSDRLHVPTVVCGPGSMAQGHKPDEYVDIGQIERCDAMLDRLLERLVIGV